MTEPLTPAECDLRGMPFMPLDVVRLGDSDLFALSTGDEFKAAVSLWSKSWLQVPAASLPDDDRILAHLSGAGSRWPKVRDMAMRGWVKCSDGRLYHPVVAEKAREAWRHREQQRARVMNRWKDRTPPDDAPVTNSGEKAGTVRAERMKAARAKGTHTPREWAALVEVCGAKCLRCDAAGRLEKDHIIPVYAGGSDAIDNLQPLCPACNCRKGPDQRDLRPPNWRVAMDTVTRTAVSPRHNPGSTASIQGTGTVTVKEPPSHPSGGRSPLGRRLPADWHPDEADRAFAVGLALLPDAVGQQFRDFWHAKPGKDGRKLDWSATWRNWCRREAERIPKPQKTATSGKLDWLWDQMKTEAEEAAPTAARLIQ